METINILIIASAAVLILLLWFVVGVRHLRHLRKAIKEQWELVDEDLRKRHDLIPNLVETVRWYDQSREELIGKIIAVRHNAAREYNPGSRKIEYEHELSALINETMALGGPVSGGHASGGPVLGGPAGELLRDTNFLELKKEIDDLEQNIEERTAKYNEMVRYYNRHRGVFFLRPLAGLFRYNVENIFEMER